MTCGGHESYLRLEHLSKTYGHHIAVADVSLEIGRGEMVVLLGPSGCGKTTTLRMIAGFAEATGGEITLDGYSLLELPSHKRELGIVFQSYALFPHMTVAANVGFGLEMRGMPRNERRARVDEMLRLVKLEAYADRLPRQLSGGQQQRVALARALAIRPKVLLLDEPLSNLDAALRQEVAREIRILQRESMLTTIMVTHDQDEAMAMADRLVVMNGGRVEQIGSQEDLYERPATAFVARFIGHSNMLPGRLQDGSLLALEGGHRVSLAGSYASHESCALAVRPERITLAPHSAGGEARATGRVELCSYLGSVVEHVVSLGPELRVVVRGPSSGAGAGPRFSVGDTVSMLWSEAGERLFDDEGRPAALLGPEQAGYEITTSGRLKNA